MTMRITNALDSAPGAAVYPISDNTVSTSVGTAITPATVLVARKGPYGKVIEVTGNNWKSILGKPLAPSNTYHEGLRHLRDAVKRNGLVSVVRAMATDALMPWISVPKTEAAVTTGTVAPNVMPSMPAGGWIQLWVKDGDLDAEISVELIDAAVADSALLPAGWKFSAGQILLNILKDGALVEKHRVSLDVDAVDDVGISIYLPTALERDSNILSVSLVSDAETYVDVNKDADGYILKSAFAGGTCGTTYDDDAFIAAWDLLSQPDNSWTHSFAAGVTSGPVLQHAINLSTARLAPFKFDAPCTMNETQALAWLEALNVNSYMAQCFHYPYKADDADFGGKVAWGLSGQAVSSKAYCYQQKTGNGSVPGAHFALAGRKRATIDRSGIEPLFVTGKASPVSLVSGRLNTASAGGQYINDVLTTWKLDSYLRFEHVPEIMVVMARELLAALSFIQFDPDSDVIEVLTSTGKDIQDKYAGAGAAVTPRDPTYGVLPITFEFTQEEIDLWNVSVGYAPTGVARRFGLQFGLMK